MDAAVKDQQCLVPLLIDLSLFFCETENVSIARLDICKPQPVLSSNLSEDSKHQP